MSPGSPHQMHYNITGSDRGFGGLVWAMTIANTIAGQQPDIGFRFLILLKSRVSIMG
jgi:hypothetical protein